MLPDRVSSCVGDLSIYKTNTQRQVDKLLVDDFNKNSNDLMEGFNNTGRDIVKQFKRGISVDVFDELVAEEKRKLVNAVSLNVECLVASQLKANEIPQLKQLIKETQDMQNVFANGLYKMKDEYKTVLQNCQAENTPACSVVARAISVLEVKSPLLEKLELPTDLEKLIDNTSKLNFEQELRPIEKYFLQLEKKIQDFANKKRDGKSFE